VRHRDSTEHRTSARSAPIGRGAAAMAAAVLAISVMTACGDDDDAGGQSGSSGPASTATQTGRGDAGVQEAGSGVTDYVKYTGGTAGAADKSKPPIAIGWVNQQGGPHDIGPTATAAADFTVKYINEKLGGIDGHPVVLRKCFTATAEEQGQACGQKLVNDKDVQQIAVGAVALGAQSLAATIGGEKPMTYSVAVGPSDANTANAYILFGDGTHILAPWGTFGRDVLKAKRAALIYPQIPGIAQGAQAMADGLKKAGISVKRVGYSPNATDLLAPLTAAGAQSTDMIVPFSDARSCANLAKALERAQITAAVVANPLCLSPDVAKALGGDVPKWYYGISSTLAADTADPAATAFMNVATQYGVAKDAVADPWWPIVFAQLLTHVKWSNAVGADNITADAIAKQAKAFKGPLVLGPPTLACGKYPDAPAVCNDQTKFYKYEGFGKFEPAAGWLAPPE
jgi:branched-chain amino acid transport system substrate-binding protein